MTIAFFTLFLLLNTSIISVSATDEVSGTETYAVSETSTVSTVEYYYTPSCGSCKEVEGIIGDLKNKYPAVSFEEYDISERENYEKMISRNGALTPFVYCNGYGFGEKGIKDGSLEKAITGTYIPPEENKTDGKNNTNLENETNKTLIDSTVSEKFDFLKSSGAVGNYLNEKIKESKYLFAYAFGIFSGLSTCLVAMVGFIFVYTADAESVDDENKKGKRSEVFKILYRLLVFSAGLITCYLIIGYAFILFKKSLADMTILSYVVGIVVILIGLNMMGILKVPIDTGEKFKEFARKYVSSTPGLFLIGCLFSFIKVPCTFPFLIILIDKTVVTGNASDILMLFIFCLGVVTPLILLGALGSYAVTKMIRKYKKEIRIVSGIVLIILGFWVMFY
ncbi:MAG: cytochrome c biogenesis protein [Methanosarcinaceae archaeon]|nr:cytochrome c biogenesis protein [Methanosarcinaceae archaeon]